VQRPTGGAVRGRGPRRRPRPPRRGRRVAGTSQSAHAGAPAPPPQGAAAKMPGGQGLRHRTRDLFQRGFRQKGFIPLSTYLRVYKVGDYVDIKMNPAVQKVRPLGLPGAPGRGGRRVGAGSGRRGRRGGGGRRRRAPRRAARAAAARRARRAGGPPACGAGAGSRPAIAQEPPRPRRPRPPAPRPLTRRARPRARPRPGPLLA
jgi:hypothetical protein